jgi:hypothetical protein
MSGKKTVAVGGALAQKARQGGLSWVFLQYLLGFRDLGYDVLFLDRLEPDMCIDANGARCGLEDSINLRYLEAVMERVGADYTLFYDGGRESAGVPRAEMLDRIQASLLFLNVSGFIDDADVLDRARLRVFLDIDPGFWQMWRELGLHDAFRSHDAYVTVGENIGRPDCKIPTGGLDWITTPQPIVLELWPEQPPEDGPFTSVGSWRGPFGPIDYDGETYGLRVHEFRNFVELPRLVNETGFEIALDIHEAEVRDLELLRTNGWSIADPQEVAGDPWTYQSYIGSSKAEFGVAKNMYVRANSGWFSDRSICYLASGRPVLAQDTGFRERYCTGEGLFAFRTLDEAAAGVEAICRDYSRHARAARALAEKHFDSRKVLGRLLNELAVA